MLGQIRDGSFLTAARLRFCAFVLLAGYAIALLYLGFSAHGLVDSAGRPLGSDFSSFYAAGKLALTTPYDQAALYKVQQSLFGPATPYYAFAYPPIFLLLLMPLAMLPYSVALLVWQGSSFAFYLWAMLRLRARYAANIPAGAWLLGAIAFPACFLNLLHGQTGFLAAGLFALALAEMEARPWLAGFAIGLLSFKPQLGLLVPFALVAGGRWKTFTGAAITVAALTGISVLTFGIESWRGFLEATNFARIAILDENAVGYEKLVSIFAALRLWRAPLALAYGAQVLAAIAVIAATVILWRRPANHKFAALIFGTLLVTPFALDYDMMILAPALGLLAAEGKQRGFAPYDASLLALIALSPILARGAAGLYLPIAAMAILGGFFITFCPQKPAR